MLTTIFCFRLKLNAGSREGFFFSTFAIVYMFLTVSAILKFGIFSTEKRNLPKDYLICLFRRMFLQNFFVFVWNWMADRINFFFILHLLLFTCFWQYPQFHPWPTWIDATELFKQLPTADRLLALKHGNLVWIRWTNRKIDQP